MSEIEDLKRRLTKALDRIETGIAALKHQTAPVAAPVDEDTAALQEALEAEKVANAQLEERVKAIKSKQENMVSSLEAQVKDLSETAASDAVIMRQLKQVNAQLRENNTALRAANETGVGDAHLINKAMLAELESLRATRAADVGEMDAILADLKPLIGEGA